jgi:hypothetical protein
MNLITNIVIVGGADESLIAKIFHGSPIPLSVTNDPKQADRMTSDMDNPLVFVELDDDVIGAREMLEQLIASVNLPLFQLILLSSTEANIDLKEQLKKIYTGLKFLEFDRKNAGGHDIAALIRKSFSEIYPDQDYTNDIIKQTDEELLAIRAPSAKSKETEKNIGTTERNTNILSRTFSEDVTNREKKYLNGDVYIQIRELGSLLDKDYLPERAAYQAAIEKLEEECTNWERSHFHRSAFASYNILQSLHIEHSLIDVARAASLLYFFPTGVSSESLTRAPYIRGSQSTVKTAIIRSLRANAASFNEQSELREIAPIIEKIANIIDNERTISDPSSSNEKNVNKIASTIILADLIDRECWQDCYWDSTGIYAIIRWIESDAGKNIDSDVVWESMRFLAETLEATPPEHVVTKQKRRELLESPPTKRNETNNENTLRISQLTPGMRLAKPLLTFDGKPVLDNDINLDHNLIWRIWRLSSLYPLEPAQIIA